MNTKGIHLSTTDTYRIEISIVWISSIDNDGTVAEDGTVKDSAVCAALEFHTIGAAIAERDRLVGLVGTDASTLARRD